MKVFSTYFKILKKNGINIGVYVFVFLIIAVMFSMNRDKRLQTDFEESKILVSVMNHDEESVFSAALRSYLNEHSDLVRLDEEKDNIQDALFYREVEYVIEIPENFYEDFKNGKDVRLQKKAIEKSFSSALMDQEINKFLNTWKDYQEVMPDKSEDEIGELVLANMAVESKVIVKREMTNNILEQVASFYNAAAYSILGAIIMGIALVLGTFLKDDMRKRNLCSSVQVGKMNLLLTLASFLFATAIWGINVGMGVLMFGKECLNREVLLMILNLYVFTLCALSIGVLVSQLARSNGVLNLMTNAISLSLCFLGGSFVPQKLLGETALSMAVFTPSYWYVKANDMLGATIHCDWESVKKILYCYAVQLGFAVAIFCVGMLIAKQKSYGTK